MHQCSAHIPSIDSAVTAEVAVALRGGDWRVRLPAALALALILATIGAYMHGHKGQLVPLLSLSLGSGFTALAEARLVCRLRALHEVEVTMLVPVAMWLALFALPAGAVCLFLFASWMCSLLAF